MNFLVYQKTTREKRSLKLCRYRVIKVLVSKSCLSCIAVFLFFKMCVVLAWTTTCVCETTRVAQNQLDRILRTTHSIQAVYVSVCVCYAYVFTLLISNTESVSRTREEMSSIRVEKRKSISVFSLRDYPWKEHFIAQHIALHIESYILFSYVSLSLSLDKLTNKSNQHLIRNPTISSVSATLKSLMSFSL